MATCKHCGKVITFGPHPHNPEKLAPFDPGGTLHFTNCAFEGSRKDQYHYIMPVGDFITVGFKREGSGNEQTFSVVLEAHQQEVRCQTMKKGSKIFFEITGEVETNQFLSALVEFAKKEKLL